jgi:hypothetical protein
MPPLADAQGVTNGSSLGLGGKSIEVKAALIIAISGRPSKDELGFGFLGPNRVI